MGFRRACFWFYWRARRLLAPSLEYSASIYEEILFARTGDGGRWLDLGCGHKLLPPWRLEQERALTARPALLVGLDGDCGPLRRHRTLKRLVRGDISSLPFPAASFDLVTANMVLEHLREPDRQLGEIFRVLAPGGALVFHTPNKVSYSTLMARIVPERLKARLIWFLQRRREEDVVPTFYRINTERTVRALAAGAGFEVASLRLVVSSPQFILIPPLLVLELGLLRLLMLPAGRRFRNNIIAVLARPPAVPAEAAPATVAQASGTASRIQESTAAAR